MANQHMITAAGNLERALSDVNLYKNELRTNLDTLKRTSGARLKQIEVELQASKVERGQADTQQQRAVHDNNTHRLEQEKAQLNEQIAAEESRVNSQLPIADKNIADIMAFIKRLQIMA